MIVNVEVVLPRQVALPETAICRVEVHDVTLLDESSTTLASCEVSVAQVSEPVLRMPALEAPDSDTPSRDYSVWAHLSLAGARQIRADDYVTTCAYPIRPGTPTTHVVVELQPVSPSQR